MNLLIPVILTGGSGTRLWPLSRQLNPKQFLRLLGEKTMLQQTLERLQGLPCSGPIAVCNEEHRFLAGEQIIGAGIKDFSIILEPVSKNTAPAIALAAIHAMDRDEDALLLVLPADHIIANSDSFRKAVMEALPSAEEGKLVTFGVVPKHPETGYGYIQRGNEQGPNIFKVASFTEKPDEERAKEYIDSGEYYWNSGMFLFKATTYLEELQKQAPKVFEACSRAMKKTEKDLDFIRIDQKTFENSPSISIDYAVMERTDLASVVPLDVGWSDIGSWTALWEACGKDEDGNTLNGDVKIIDTKDSLIRAESRLVAALGVKDLVVVETRDAVLVAHKDHVQKVKNLVEDIKQNGRYEHLNQREVFRPWGSYDSLETGDRFQVKRIRVKPGARLSLQMHHHRAEHWIVVKGSAKVAIDGETVLLTENESTFIPVGKVHSLENPGKIPLELIEVQSGSYLGEDDIVRLEDRYGRC